jgi:hypothetical protein
MPHSLKHHLGGMFPSIGTMFRLLKPLSRTNRMKIHLAKDAIDNLINGNLTEAKDISVNLNASDILNARMGQGYNYNEALLMASYLKGLISFQDYCDNSNNKA